VGARGGIVGSGTALQAGRSRVQFPMVSLEFFIDIILPVALWPWGWLRLQQKWIPGKFCGGKGGQCIGLKTLPPSCADHLVIWEPQTPGTLRACPGIALAFKIGWECNPYKGNEKFSIERRHYMGDLEPGRIPVPLDMSVWPFWPPPT
jgi:hypothetical protein